MKLFGSSGIRGRVNVEFTPQLALEIGIAVGSRYRDVVVGRDPRTGSELVECALVSGLLSTGCRVFRVGMVSTPTLALATRGHDAGVMVTASHNPPDYVGVKLWNPNGKAFDTGQQAEIEKLLEERDSRYLAGWQKLGRVEEKRDALAVHAGIVRDEVGELGSPLRVVVDCGCGASSVITPYLLREMGCEVVTLNCQPDGFFPGRLPEPTRENLRDLCSTVKALGASLGVASDGDGDRMAAVDENGAFVPGDVILALLARAAASRRVVVPVDTSLAVEDYLEGVEVRKTRVGDVYVAEELFRCQGDFGGEASGSYIFPQTSYCPDGVMAAARLVKMVEEKRLSQLASEVPKYSIKRGSLPLEGGKEKVMEKVKEALWGLGEVTLLDGVRVDLEDGWALVRPSGTEPKIRITAESRGDASKIYQEIEKIVKKTIF